MPPLVWVIASGAVVSLLVCGIGAFGPIPGLSSQPVSRPTEQPAIRDPLITPTIDTLIENSPAPAPLHSTSNNPHAVHYAGCAEARAAGAAPILRSEAGYRPALDPDADGIACEESEGNAGNPAPSGSPASGTNDPRFATCKQARAAGFGPYVKGQDPEYYWYPDPNRDGTVCN